MAGTPRWKVYTQNGEYMAACKELEAAAALLAFYGHGAHIRDGHRRAVYVNGITGDASDSFDAVAEFVRSGKALDWRSRERQAADTADAIAFQMMEID